LSSHTVSIFKVAPNNA